MPFRQIALNMKIDTVSQITLRLRKPPVVLIHGYNTPGDWGSAFILELSRSRPLPVDDFHWVRVAKYGVGQTAGAYVSQMINTLYPLADLVPLAEQAYDEAIAPLREQWAFTRFDAVCHSQGGLLTRMLCSQNTGRTLSRPFRNELNHNRGRFHRVVTIGSPHNGTRLLRYLLALDESKFSLSNNRLRGCFAGGGQHKKAVPPFFKKSEPRPELVFS
jgi:pimeloyl-ACP methyl ester carboxylesterase